MSEGAPVTPGSPRTPPSAPPPRDGCLTASMVIVGIILLLPGLCAVYFLGIPHLHSNLVPLILAGIIVGFFILAKIRSR